MAITTLTRYKTLTGTTGTDKDTQIDALIPQVEADYQHIRNRPFDTGTKVTIETTGLPADEEVTVTIGNYADVGATADGWEYEVRLREDDTADMIAKRIVTQIKPTAYYKMFIASAGSTQAILYMLDKFPDYMERYSVLDLTIDTSTEIETTVEQMQTIYPDGAEMVAAQMIKHQLNTIEAMGIASESLGDYSVQYSGSVLGVYGSYPKSVAGGIQRFAVTL